MSHDFWHTSTRRFIMPSSAVSVASNRDEILVFDRAHVSKREFNQRLRATRSSHKLDLPTTVAA
jgi:Na+-transporting NADH:ubiquinone oxidoreductase subunit NqrF